MFHLQSTYTSHIYNVCLVLVLNKKTAKYYSLTGRKIAHNTGANATKFFTLATKYWKVVAKLATRISSHTLPRDLMMINDL